MDLNISYRRKYMFIILVLLHAFYFVLFNFSIQTSSELTTVAAVLIIFLSSLMFGILWGFLSGLLIAFAQILSILLELRLGLPFSAAQLTALIARPDLLSSLMLPCSGLIIGYYTDKFGIYSFSLEKQVRRLTDNNKAMTSQLDHYERQFQNLSQQKVYRKSWDSLLEANEKNESLFGLLAASASQETRQRSLLSNSPSQLASQEKQTPELLFELLLQIRPDVLAVFDFNGKIIQTNDKLLAIYGYRPDELNKLTNFLELLQPADAAKASFNMAKGIKLELISDEYYQVKSPGGGFSKLLISPWIKLECNGNPLTLVACVSQKSYHLLHENLESSEAALPKLSDLDRINIGCLTTDHRIAFVCPAVAERLAETSKAMIGQKVKKYISPKHAARLEDFLGSCQLGGQNSIDLEMMPYLGRRTIFRFNAYPAIGVSGQYLGVTFMIDDITSVTLVEEALRHRLSMEKLISSISARFISIRAENLEKEIFSVIKLIGDFEEAEESILEIYQSVKISKPEKFHIINQKLTTKNYSEISYGQSSESDRYEAVNIPIVIESNMLGNFRFYSEQYRTKWFETDLKMIQLIGEIIMNALIRKENELAIEQNATWLSKTIHAIGDAIIALDVKGRIILMNKEAENLTGWDKENALNKPLNEVFAPYKDTNPANADTPNIQELYPFSETDSSMILESLDGSSRYISINRNLIEGQSNELYGEVIIFRDVTRKKQENDEIRFISYHDKLTGLYNRTFFEEELAHLNKSWLYPITIILGDCNGLKIANDIFGHLEGDKLLQNIANILRRATRHDDIVARWGGDEFAIILPRTDEQSATAFRERILQLCAEAQCDPIQPSLALGSATNTDGSSDLVALLKLAEDRMYRHKLMEGKSTRNSILMSIEKLIFEKSYETEEHASRLAEVSKRFGQAVGLSDYDQEELNLLCVLHDMGKVGIPDNILLKPGQLTENEWTIMKKHSEKGYNLAKSTPELNSIADPILYHHERWDGTGYPAGLQGEQIPKLSRILAIVDAYDVITHSRTYKEAQSKEDALLEISNCSGTQFDPELSEVFVQIMQEDLQDQSS